MPYSAFQFHIMTMDFIQFEVSIKFTITTVGAGCLSEIYN